MDRRGLRWSDSLTDLRTSTPPSPFLIGVLEGEGIGPEVVGGALDVLSAVESAGYGPFELRFGGAIGCEAERVDGAPLTSDVISFCDEVFSGGGALFCGPGGGRFVYDLRREFDLFCKISPVTAYPEISGAGRLKPGVIDGTDLVIVRENSSGIYQGSWSESATDAEGRIAEHKFSYTEREVVRIIRVAADIAGRRSGRLMVVVKDGGVPTVSALWRDCGAGVTRDMGIDCSFVNVDYAGYLLFDRPRELDVIVTPNLFGDILIDLAGMLSGSRGNTFSGNFAGDRTAVYQTNHGAAYDLAGRDRANPVGQILSLAMMLRESFGLVEAAALIETAVLDVWRRGWRTDDLTEPRARIAGTTEMCSLVREATLRRAGEAVA